MDHFNHNCDGVPAAPDFDPIAAYMDGYQQSIEAGWPSPDHLGTEPFEYGFLDGADRYFGDSGLVPELVG